MKIIQMKTTLFTWRPIMWLVGLNIIAAAPLAAQTVQTLYSFGMTGRGPEAGLTISGSTLYGTTAFGGSSGYGTVFALSTDGTGFKVLHTFSATSDSTGTGTNLDGAFPFAELILCGNTLYGTTRNGGSLGGGTVFKLIADGTGFVSLHSFPTVTGAFRGLSGPVAGLILSGDTLYGTTAATGSQNKGSVFAIKTDGSGFTTLYSFSGSSTDGGDLEGALILCGDTLYGTAAGANTSSSGKVFAISTNGTSFRILHSFSGSDGMSPKGALVVSGNTLYGTTQYGGSADVGTVFMVNVDGTNFRTLHTFLRDTNGVEPIAGLVLLDNTLYGTARHSNSDGRGMGTIFAVSTDGTGFTALHRFVGYPNDGSNPNAGLALSGSTLYGTTYWGGSFDSGTVLALRLPARPKLTIARASDCLVLRWPCDFTTYTLQITTNLGSQVWATVMPPPVLINGQNTVTNPISGTPQFYRLNQ
jgi:uncharacterized repeat protein (TIGR03803 family)